MSAKKMTLKDGIQSVYPQTTDDVVFFEKKNNKTLRKVIEDIEENYYTKEEAEGYVDNEIAGIIQRMDTQDASLDSSIVAMVTEYNISLHQKNMTTGSPRYDTSIFTLQEAIAQVPDNIKRGGLKLTFNSNDSSTSTIFSYMSTYVLDKDTWNTGLSYWKEFDEHRLNNVRDNNAYCINNTAAATAAKVLADDNCPNLDYNKNVRLLIKFNNGNTADDVTLTILNKTYPFYYRGARASATNCWEARDILDCRFDMATNRWYSEPWNGVGMKREIEGVLKESDLGYIIESDNIANPANVSNRIISSTGGIEDTSGDWQIVSIPVTPGQIITFGGFYLGRTGYYAFYNGNTKISYSVFNDPNGTTSPVTVTVPDGAAVLHIDIKTSQSPTNPYQYLQANIGSSLKSYDEFKQEIKTIKEYDLYGSGCGSDLSTLIQDLPVSNGTGIASGYAYIDSTDRCVKVKE